MAGAMMERTYSGQDPLHLIACRSRIGCHDPQTAAITIVLGSNIDERGVLSR